MDRSTHLSNGGCMVTADGRTLPLKGASLTADAKAGIARVTLTQRFFNPHAEPLQVTYQMPLPADAAVSGFSFVIGDKRVIGEVDAKHKARARFEEAVLQGRTAALLDQERSSLFTQSVGNIPPNTEVVSELVIDQKLAFLSDGFWEWRFPTVVAPRYLGAQGRVADAAKVTVDVADPAMPVRLSLSLSVRDRLPDGARPESPSHALHTEKGVQRFDVSLASESGASLDRDVVVRWRAGELKPGVELDLGRPRDGAAAESAYALVTLVPPSVAARMESVPRDLILLLDTSGSMDGAPIRQMQRVASALIDSLGEDDFVEMISFSNSPQRWRWRPVKATANNRKDAQAWVSKLQAGGGTEMREGILEALQPLRKDAQRQVVLMTDGLIGFESEIVQAICERLPGGSRVHTVGIGSGVNRSLTQPAARAGRGVEIVIGLDEDPERGAQRIVARTNAPLVTRVEIYGSAVDGLAPARPGDLFAGSPALCSLKLKPHGGEIIVRGETAQGRYEERLEVKPVERGEGSGALAKLFAREQVEDLEVELAAGLRDRAEIDRRITSLGIDFQISTRLTSWVAVSPEPTVDPRAPKRGVNQPQELPYGMSAEGLGLRAGMPAPAAERAAIRQALAQAKGARSTAAGMLGMPRGKLVERLKQFGLVGGDDAEAPSEEQAKAADPADQFEDAAGEPAFDASEGFDGGEVNREEAEARELPAEPVARRRQGAPPPAPKAPAGPPAARPAAPAPAQSLARSAAPMKKKEAEGGGGAAKDEKARQAPPRRQPMRRLKARFKWVNGKLVVQFTVDGDPITWTPKDAIVALQAGTVRAVPIDPTVTTVSGTYPAGIQLTLVLEGLTEADAPVNVTLAGDLALELEAA
jgi:Ca-activated chloride channel family protein